MTFPPILGIYDQTWSLCVVRYRFSDEDIKSGLHHHHPEAVGHRRTGEVAASMLLSYSVTNKSIPRLLQYFIDL